MHNDQHVSIFMMELAYMDFEGGKDNDPYMMTNMYKHSTVYRWRGQEQAGHCG